MKRNIAPVLLSLALATLPFTAFAQSVNVSSSPSTTSYGPGQSSVVLGTVTLSSPTGTSAQIYSIPLTLNTGNGAGVGDLQNCSLYNYGMSNNAITTGANIRSNLTSGANTFTFDAPFTVTSSPTTLTIRCDIRSGSITNGTYSFVAGTPGFVSTSSVPAADLTVFGNVVRGTTGAPIAAVTFVGPTSGTATYNFTSLPLTATYGGGLSSAYLSGCMWKNGSAVISTPTAGTIVAGSSVTPFQGSFVVPSSISAPMTLVLSCNVAATAPVGGTLALTLNRGSLTSTNTSTGAGVATGAGSLNTDNGVAVIIAGGNGTGTGTSSGGVGVPNTGAGGNAPLNVAIMALALIAIAGAVYALARPRLVKAPRQ